MTREAGPRADWPGGIGRLLSWAAVGVAVIAGGIALDFAGLPSSYLFAALLVGLAIALRVPGRFTVGRGWFRASQAIAGVVLGTYLQSDALAALAHDWLPVALVSLSTLALSLGAGVILARTTSLDAPTASLGMIAGGASGIVGMSGDLGADDRLVAFIQYLRVLIVVFVTPIGIAVFFGGHHGGAGPEAVPTDALGDPGDWALAAVLALFGALAASLLRVTAGVLLGPMVLTGMVVLSGAVGGFVVPDLLAQAAFALIGLQVGLSFTRSTVRALGPLTRPVLLLIGALLVACFGLAVLLDLATSASLVDCYLATTPGGLYAVLAVAAGTGANTTFIVAVQSLRVFVMVLLAPAAVRLALRGTAAVRPGDDPSR